MANTLTMAMVEQSTEDLHLWHGIPDQIAQELYPDSPMLDLNKPCGDQTLSDADLACMDIYSRMGWIMKGVEQIPGWVQSDQFEDYIAACAVKYVLDARAVAEAFHKSGTVDELGENL